MRELKSWRYDDVYAAIVKCLEENNGRPPSVRELMAMTNIPSTGAINKWIARLVKDGKITKAGIDSRAIQIPGAIYIIPEEVKKSG